MSCRESDANGETPFTIWSIRVFSSAEEVVDESGKSIAFHLMRYGDWCEREHAALTEDSKVVGIRFVRAPIEPVEGQEFQTVGTLSSMVSSAYRELTVRNGTVFALDVKHDPASFALDIPEDYRGSLPLWQFITKPNYHVRMGVA